MTVVPQTALLLAKDYQTGMDSNPQALVWLQLVEAPLRQVFG